MLEVVAGPPFAGKSQYVDREIARREAEGESGIDRIDFTALFLALFPGAADAVRTEATVGVPLVAYLRETAIRQAQERELDGYVTTAKPEAAERLRERFEVQTITVVDTPKPEVQRRMEKHLRRMFAIRRHAERKARIRGECSKAVADWFQIYTEREWHRKVTTGSYRR